MQDIVDIRVLHKLRQNIRNNKPLLTEPKFSMLDNIYYWFRPQKKKDLINQYSYKRYNMSKCYYQLKDKAEYDKMTLFLKAELSQSSISVKHNIHKKRKWRLTPQEEERNQNFLATDPSEFPGIMNFLTSIITTGDID